MVARGGAAQQRNPGKDEKIYWNPVRGGIMRGFNIYTCFSCNAFDDKGTTIWWNPLCHPSGVPINWRLPRGFRLRLRLRRDRSPLTRLHHRAILWRPCGAQNLARCARGIWEEERLTPW